MRAILLFLAGLGAATTGVPEEDVYARTEPVDFNREIWPIFAEHCLDCHGPDGRSRESDLRLDLPEDLFRDLGGYQAVVPGNADDSELYLRVSDPDDPMPPRDDEGHREGLSDGEIEAIRNWIDEGATWSPHWSFVPPERPGLPPVSDSTWPQNPIDDFVLARLDAIGLPPSPPASRETLIRRATLDLTGLPPTPAEVDAFLADEEPQAYETVVDRLLESPRFGEAMAIDWLDAARYADTHGLHLDNERSIWPWRDWVISSLNANMPFDRFTTEQIAGDLLPDANQDQQIASGFNRCNPTTAEGGLIKAEYLAKYASDRASTTSTVWLGLSAACARCHDHRYDPITQEDFYGLYAFFNNLAEEASDGNGPTPPPNLAIPTAEEVDLLNDLQGQADTMRERMASPMPDVDAEQVTWEASWTERLFHRWTPLLPTRVAEEGGATLELQSDGSILATGENPEGNTYTIEADLGLSGVTGLRLDLIPDESCFRGGVGRASNGNLVLTEVELAVAAVGSEDYVDVPLVNARADYSQDKYDIAKAIDGDDTTGWAVDGRPNTRVAVFAPATPLDPQGGGRLRLRLRHGSEFPQHTLGRFRLSVTAAPSIAPTTASIWSSLGPIAATSADAAFRDDLELGALDGDGWEPHPEYEDGAILTFEGELSAIYLRRTLTAPEPRHVTLSLGSDDAIKVWLDGELVLTNDVRRGVAADQETLELDLKKGDSELLVKVVNDRGAFAFVSRMRPEELGGVPLEFSPTLLTAANERSEDSAVLLRDHYRRRHSDEWAALEREVLTVEAEHKEVSDGATITMVSAASMTRRQAYFLERGEYDAPGDPIDPAVPAFLPPLQREAVNGGPANRLDLALWLSAPANPLPARVTVNRFWQRHFGRGLVDTPGDFGSRGALPSHPQLLDWLAVEFTASGWDMKHMRRLMVTSATYRQDSRIPDRSRASDPENRLLSHAPRIRLSGEALRDSALAMSGLLVDKMGGPGVNPYQPTGIWEAVAYTGSNTAKYTRGMADDLHRRSIYTFWKRTAPPPVMQIFDAPSREACTVGRTTTTTPLQALALMNDVQFVEAARFLAQRMLLEGGTRVETQATFGFRLATSRFPTNDELMLLVDLYAAQRREFNAQPELARDLLMVGEAGRNPELNEVRHAAWTVVANMILNLDEVVTRG